MLHVLVTAVDVQDRDGGILLLSTLFGQFPSLRKLFADSAYTGPIFQDGIANTMPSLVIEIVRRSDHAKGFVVEPMRWIVERTIGWLGRCRRLAKDWENRNHNALAFLRLASIRLTSEKLCKILYEVSGRTLRGLPDVDTELVDAGKALRAMQQPATTLKILVLDACRNNPFQGRGLRTPGLAECGRRPAASFPTRPSRVV